MKNSGSHKTAHAGKPSHPNHQRLSELRDALLALHKTVVDSEKVSYEATVGKIQSPNHFLQLLTGDPWFAWLQPFSQLIVAMDQALEEKEPLTSDGAEALFDRTRKLLVAGENVEGFSGDYYEALQRDPEVVVAHSEVMKLARAKK